MRALREALAAVRRAPLLSGLSVLAIGLSLLVLGLFGLMTHNVDVALSRVEERVQVVAYLADDVREEAVELARKEIGSYPEVRRVRYISSAEALADARRELEEFSDVFSALEVNPLPPSLEVELHEGSRDPESAREIAGRVAGYPFVEDVRYGREWLNRLHALRRIAGGGALLLGGGFAVAAVLLVGTTVRMAILARRKEIFVMQSVGATDGYIRRPFLVEGALTGLAGAFLALGLTRATYAVARDALFRLAWLPATWILLGLAMGALLGMFAAARSVRKEIDRYRAV